MNYYLSVIFTLLCIVISFINIDILIYIGISLAFIFGWYIIKVTLQDIKRKMRGGL